MKKLLLLILCLVLMLGLCACGSSRRQVIVWEDLALSAALPEPAYLAGEVSLDTEDYLSVTIYRTDAKAFDAYAAACQKMGFTIDKSKSEWDFHAFNADGYELLIWHDDKEMDISLTAPVEMYPLTWPSSALGRMLPVPESDLGQVSYDGNDWLEVYVGNTDRAAYGRYVTACIDAGFDLDYSRGEDYFYAHHPHGYNLSVDYQGFNVMRINLSEDYE